MGGSDLLLHGLDKELGDLGGSQLVPCQGRLGSWEDDESDRVREVVDRKGVYSMLAGARCRIGSTCLDVLQRI
jgi:hypothetical protein